MLMNMKRKPANERHAHFDVPFPLEIQKPSHEALWSSQIEVQLKPLENEEDVDHDWRPFTLDFENRDELEIVHTNGHNREIHIHPCRKHIHQYHHQEQCIQKLEAEAKN